MHIINEEASIVALFPPGPVLGQLTAGIIEAVQQSFARQQMQNPTRAEVKRRFNVCMKWAKIMRGDLSFGMERLIGQLEFVLQADLNGTTYEPSARQCWIPSDGA